MEKCIAALSSMTYALKAKQALDESVIYSNIVKLDSDMTKKGCTYGLEISCNQLNNVKAIFKRKGIKIREYVGDSDNSE